jgi:SAM-dependent methyltransferase
MAATLADSKSVHYELKPSPYSSHSILLAALPEDGQGLRVLDLGCANGELAAILASRGFQVTGVERPGGFDSRFPTNVELVAADLDGEIPTLGRKYDFVLCADILEHLKDPARLLRAIHQFLQPSGLLIASLPNSGNIYFRANVLMGKFPQDDKGLFDRTHLHFYMRDGWVRLFGECGFAFHSERPTGIPVGLKFPQSAGSLWIKTAESVCFRLARLWMTLFAYQFVVVAAPSAQRGVSR